MAEAIQTRQSVAEFEALPESRNLTELVEGVFLVRKAPSVNHQRVVARLSSRLSTLIPNGEIFILRTSVKFNDENYYQPDVCWVAEDGASIIHDDGLDGAPDLVVEVISPGTAKIDRGSKFKVYEASGVREYWIVEPDLGFLQVWVLTNGIYQQQGTYEADEEFVSAVLGKTSQT